MGTENIDKVINIDQSPIGRTPDLIRLLILVYLVILEIYLHQCLSQKQEDTKQVDFLLMLRGSVNHVAEQVYQIEMQFLPDVTVPCEICLGKRYNREALEIKFKELSISDVLDKTVSEAAKIFENQPSI